MTEDAIKYAEAQLMCATVCERYGLSPESTAMALGSYRTVPRRMVVLPRYSQLTHMGETMIDDLRHLPPRDLGTWLDDCVAFLSLVAIALILLAFWGLW